MELRNFFKKNQIKNIAKKEQDFYQKNTQKKFLKIFAAVSLALITCATTLLATAPFGANNATAAAAESEMTAQEKLASGTLNLNPETDPTIYTTESGLEIKFGGATLTSGALNGYTYFTMGTYNNTPVNWVIIGRHSQGFSATGGTLAAYFASVYASTAFQSWKNNIFEYQTSAGNAIFKDKILYDHINGGTFTFSSLEASGTTVDSDLNPGEILVISEILLGENVTWKSSPASSGDNDYEESDFKTYINNLYNSTLGLTVTEKACIEPQTLTNYYRGSGTSTTTNAYLFPLAARGENFNMNTYLNSNALRDIDIQYCLRSGYSGSYATGSGPYYVDTDGAIRSSTTVQSYTTFNVRPAFVTKLK